MLNGVTHCQYRCICWCYRFMSSISTIISTASRLQRAGRGVTVWVVMLHMVLYVPHNCSTSRMWPIATQVSWCTVVCLSVCLLPFVLRDQLMVQSCPPDNDTVAACHVIAHCQVQGLLVCVVQHCRCIIPADDYNGLSVDSVCTGRVMSPFATSRCGDVAFCQTTLDTC